MTTDEARMARRFKDGYQEAAGNNERNIHVISAAHGHRPAPSYLRMRT
jgi:hypothetical protein